MHQPAARLAQAVEHPSQAYALYCLARLQVGVCKCVCVCVCKCVCTYAACTYDRNAEQLSFDQVLHMLQHPHPLPGCHLCRCVRVGTYEYV